MPKVRFTADFDWKPNRQSTLAYREGDEKLVPTACSKAAIAAGKAVKVKVDG